MTPALLDSLLRRGGQMGERIRRFDWESTPLGPMRGWPPELLTALNILLLNQSPMLVFWGEQLVVLYNDAAISIFGPKHPVQSLGQPMSSVFAEVWGQLEPIFKGVSETRRAVTLWNQLFLIQREGNPNVSESYCDACYTPLETGSG